MSSSVGLAAGATLEDAIQSGFAEVVERDACLRAWRGRWQLEAIPPGRDMAGLHLARVPDPSGLEVVVAFLESATAPLTSTGLAARPARADAIEHAVLEAVQSRLWVERWLAEHGGWTVSHPRTMIDNAVAHALRPELIAARAAWLHPSRLAGPGRGLSWQAVLRACRDAAYVDITTPDIRAAGLHVVRVVLPGRVIADDDALQRRLPGCAMPHPFG
jgi:ribosomal protein S12 methylthiotransferase accessory factor